MIIPSSREVVLWYKQSITEVNTIIGSYVDLNVWKEGRELSKIIYQLTPQFPKEEQFGLTSQMRRAAISVTSNIAEGCGRSTANDCIRFYFISRGSIYELESQLYIAFDLDYIKQKQLEEILDQIEKCRKLLNGFIKYYQNLALKSK